MEAGLPPFFGKIIFTAIFGDKTADFFVLPKREILSCSLTFLALVFSLGKNRNTTTPVGLNSKTLVVVLIGEKGESHCLILLPCTSP